jgi:hypothetical protein
MSRPATSRLKVNPALGSPPTLEWRAVGELLIDPVYQRSIDTGPSQALIRKIAMFWDWGLCQPLAVSRRPDGKLTIVDGQHRASAAKLRGDIPHLPCVITNYSNSGDEAAAFVALNQMRRPLSALDLFRAALAADDDEATTIMRAIQDAGLRLSHHSNYNSWRPGDIANIGGIQRSYRRHGEQPTRVALAALAKAWPEQVLRFAGSVFPGFVMVATDEMRLRSDPGEVERELAAFAGARAQSEWRRLSETRVAENGGGRVEAMVTVFRAAWRSRHSANQAAAQESTAWCEQCDRKATADCVAKCTDRFCPMRKAKAA